MRSLQESVTGAYQNWRTRQDKLYNVVVKINDERTESEKELEKQILADIMDARLDDRNKEA